MTPVLLDKVGCPRIRAVPHQSAQAPQACAHQLHGLLRQRGGAWDHCQTRCTDAHTRGLLGPGCRRAQQLLANFAALALCSLELGGLCERLVNAPSQNRHHTCEYGSCRHCAYSRKHAHACAAHLSIHTVARVDDARGATRSGLASTWPIRLRPCEAPGWPQRPRRRRPAQARGPHCGPQQPR